LGLKASRDQDSSLKIYKSDYYRHDSTVKFAFISFCHCNFSNQVLDSQCLSVSNSWRIRVRQSAHLLTMTDRQNDQSADHGRQHQLLATSNQHPTAKNFTDRASDEPISNFNIRYYSVVTLDQDYHPTQLSCMNSLCSHNKLPLPIRLAYFLSGFLFVSGSTQNVVHKFA